MADLTLPLDPAGGEDSMFSRFSPSSAISLLSVALAYLAAAELGHTLALPPGNFATFWPQAGVYLAALLLLPSRRWPLVIAAAGLGNLASDWLIHGRSAPVSLAFFAVNSVSALFSAVLVLQRCGRPFYLDRLRSMLIFMGCTALVSSVAAAPLAAGLAVSVFGAGFNEAWQRWWLADLAGVWLTTPLVLGFAQLGPALLQGLSLRRVTEAAALYFSLMVVAFYVHDRTLAFPWVPSIVMMWVFWAVLRFGSAGVGSAMFMVTVTATASLVHGHGPFLRAGRSPDDAVLRLLLYLSIWAGCFYVVAAILSELRFANETLGRMNLDLERSVARRTHSLAEATDALRESQDQLKFVLDAANIGVWTIHFDTGALACSPEFRRTFGFGEDDDFSRYAEMQARIHPDDLPRHSAALAEAIEKGSEVEVEYRVVWPDGTIRWILARGRGAAPAVRRMSGVAIEITRRKVAEQELKESESTLRSYYESASLCMGLVEIEGEDIRHLYDNPASCRFFGVAPGETVGRLASELGVLRPVIDLWLENYRRSAAEGRPMRFEHMFSTASSQRWLSATVAPIPAGRDGNPRYSYLAADVTERRQSEQAVRRHAARQTALLDFTRTILSQRSDAETLGDFVFKKLSGVLDANIGLNFRLDSASGELTLVASHGIPAEGELRARSLRMDESFCGAVVAKGQALVADAAMIERDPGGEFVRALGAHAYACHPIVASDGRVLGLLFFGRTHREGFEPEEVDFIQTLGHFVAMAWERSAAEGAMLQAKEAAESANRAKDEFLAALSHELRTPLNPVLLLASELHRSADLPPEVRGDLATIRRNVELEARLIDDLLDLTRITRGKVRLERRPMAAHQALRDVLEILRSELDAKELSVRVDLSAAREHISGDPIRLQQVFWNVLRNAIKFTPPGGVVTVRTRSQDGLFFAEITDTGPGIAAGQLEKIFDTFNQGEGGHRFGGLGLGLAIARSLVQAHGGAIQAVSEGRGCGAMFRIELPLISFPSREQEAPPVAASAAAPPAPRRSLRILLLEDHEPTRLALARLLRRRGHDVSAAETLAQARGLAHAGSFDLFISDLGLPDGDGAALMRELAANGGPPGIALSGYGMEEDIQRSLDGGFTAHLVKPVDVDLLDQAMARWVES